MPGSKTHNTHACPCGCKVEIRRSQLSCATSWASLDPLLRERIQRAYAATRRNPHDVDYAAAHRHAIGQALDVLRGRRGAVR